MNYLYAPMGAFPSLPKPLTPENEQALREIVKAQKKRSLKIQIPPLGFRPVGFWGETKKVKWANSLLRFGTLLKIAQRAGVLPLKVITIPAIGNMPKQRYALYGKWADPIRGTGKIKVGIFPWQDTDLFKEQKTVHKVPWNEETRKFFLKLPMLGKKGDLIYTQSVGEGDDKQTITANYYSKKYLKLQRVTGKTGWGLVDLVVWSTLPVVKMNDLIFEKTAPLIDMFGEVIGALLDVGAAVVAPAFTPGFSAGQPYKQPNYLLWGGVAVGVVVVAAVIKKRREQ